MTLPQEFSFVDLNDKAFSTTLDECLHGTDNLVISAPAGAGKSLMIKIVASMTRNCIVLSPTGLTAMNLCCDGVKAQTFHSFFLFPPVEVILDPGPFSSRTTKAVKAAQTLIIDEISMVSNHLIDMALDKMSNIRGGTLPRILLFGDLMQLPPVVPMSNQHVKDFYQKSYDGKVMFFNSKWFKKLNFITTNLYKQYRQTDTELQRRLVEVGYNEHTSETLDYFNQRVMTLAQFEATHPMYIRMAPTNAIVNKVNAEYAQGFPGQSMKYVAQVQHWKGQTPNDDVIELKEGMQVLCTRNNYDDQGDYRNGTIGIVEKLYKSCVDIRKSDGHVTKVSASPLYQYELDVDSAGLLHYRICGSYCQIDCKPMRAMTIHKAQGKTIDAAYIQPASYASPGLMYVALSRCRKLNDFALSRPLTMRDVQYNEEAFEFLEFGQDEVAAPAVVDDGDELIGS